MEQRVEDVKELIGGVPGFASYAAFRSDDGVTTVTVCQTRPVSTSRRIVPLRGSRRT